MDNSNLLVELERHWVLLSGFGVFILFVIKFAFSLGGKSKDIVTITYLTKHCESKMANCKKEITPSLEQVKTDNLIIHELSTLIEDTRKALEDTRTALTDTVKYRKQILRGVGLVNRQTIRLRSSIANTHTILGFVADKLWKEEGEQRTMVKDILKKEQQENKNYLGDFKETFNETL